MRKSIFKLEIEACFRASSLTESQQVEVRKALFENPIDITKQYLLKKEIITSQIIVDYLKPITDQEKFVSDVRSLFQVDDDLELPTEIREQLARKENMAICIGAGVSKLLGVPLWAELSLQAIDYLHEVDLITFSEAEKIKNENISPKQRLSIFHDVLPKSKALDFYNMQFGSIKSIDKNPYDALASLQFPKITLNLDHFFWNALEKSSLKNGIVTGEGEKKRNHVYSGFDKQTKLDGDGIYQIHGSYKNLVGYSVVTMRDYLDHYFHNQNLPAFLKEVFENYNVIFIGCGMEEFELLQHLVKSSKKHHVLVGTFLNDTNLFQVRKEYFGHLNVNAHGYYLDFRGHNRLLTVIDSWVKKIDFEMNGGFYDKTGEFGDIKL